MTTEAWNKMVTAAKRSFKEYDKRSVEAADPILPKSDIRWYVLGITSFFTRPCSE